MFFYEQFTKYQNVGLQNVPRQGARQIARQAANPDALLEARRARRNRNIYGNGEQFQRAEYLVKMKL